MVSLMAFICRCMTTALLAVSLLAATATCESSRTSSSSSPDAGDDPEQPVDMIYVDNRVGYLPVEELFDRFMNDQFYGHQVAEYAEAVLETKVLGAVDSVLAYAERYESSTALKQVAQAKHPKLGPWLRAHADDLELKYWSDVGGTLAHNGWRDSVVAAVLVEQVRSNPEQRSRSAAAQAFMGMGTLDEVRTIAAIADTATWKGMRLTAIAAQARFDVPEFNDAVRAALRDTSGLHLRELKGVRLNRRHDFLPELRMTLSEYRNSDPDHHLIDNLEELIAEFEDLKANGVKPGAPLNYPNATRADSTFTQ